MTEPMLVWAFGLLALAVVFIFAELLIPSGGVLGLLATLVTGAAVVCFFRVSTTWGLLSLLAVMVLGPVVVGFALRVWPDTPVGKRMILGTAREDDEEAATLNAAEAAQRRRAAEALIGQEGVALTEMRPVGKVRVGEERVEALAMGSSIPTGARVRVVEIVDNQIKVRQIG